MLALPQADASSDTAPACAPSRLDASAALAGGAVTVSPAPGSMDASYRTQISFLGPPAAQISDVAVVGSRSGSHDGRLLAYSQGDGASFVPAKPFSQGETVTVRATVSGASGPLPVSWQFTTAEVDAVSRSLETPPPPPPPPLASELQDFASRPDLKPPAVTVTSDAGHNPEDIFLAPYAGPGQYGPMILNGAGRLIWFKPVPKGSRAADFRVQQYEGKPVLTWWQDPLEADGRRDAGVVIANSSYQDIAIVRAGNGYQPDLHAFRITPQGTAFLTVYDAIRCNLRAEGGPADGAVADTVAQEIDLRTGLVRFEWHSLDHVAMSDSYEPVGSGGTPVSPWDYFHMNMIDPEPGGEVLIDSRNTWAAYQVDGDSGQVAWSVGGKQSSFSMGPGASPAWQHDGVDQGDGTITFFDNGATPKIHPQSRAIVLRLDEADRTASLLESFTHPGLALVAASQGNLQSLPDGDWFVGWGQEPYFSEFAPGGKLLFDAHLPSSYQSYTDLRFPWSGAPSAKPSIALTAGADGEIEAHASWNGATAFTGWRLLAGAAPAALATVGSSPVEGFETTLATHRPASYVAVQALGPGGAVLATSATVRAG
ncbi:MAG: arylsulfotransferase family protein [Solirubrobacteraceae bacterium]